MTKTTRAYGSGNNGPKPKHEREHRDQTWESDRALVGVSADRFAAGKFDLDPCAADDSACGTFYYTVAEDGLIQSWLWEDVVKHARFAGPGLRPMVRRPVRVWINPPFGEIDHWVARAFHYLDTYPEHFAVIVFCVPSRTDRAWYHRLRRRCYIPDIEGRVGYGALDGSPNFSTTIAVAWPKFVY